MRRLEKAGQAENAWEKKMGCSRVLNEAIDKVSEMFQQKAIQW